MSTPNAKSRAVALTPLQRRALLTASTNGYLSTAEREAVSELLKPPTEQPKATPVVRNESIGWQLIVQAIRAVDKEAARRGEMFPQTDEDQREDRTAVRRVIDMIEWYATKGGAVAETLAAWPRFFEAPVEQLAAAPTDEQALVEPEAGRLVAQPAIHVRPDAPAYWARRLRDMAKTSRGVAKLIRSGEYESDGPDDMQDIADGREQDASIYDQCADLVESLANAAVSPAANAGEQAATAPIPMLLFCPRCGEQHIDAPEEREYDRGLSTLVQVSWTNPPHRSHLCHSCGCIWRPADVATVGVASIDTHGKADTWTAEQGSIADVDLAEADGRAAFENCSFRLCELPGQCRAEGKCHHPRNETGAPGAVAWFDKTLNTVRWKDGLVNADFYDGQPFYTREQLRTKCQHCGEMTRISES